MNQPQTTLSSTERGDTIDNYLWDGATVMTVAASDFSVKVARCAPFTRAG